MILDYLGGPSLIRSPHRREAGRPESERREDGSRGRYAASFEDGGRGHEPTNAGGL